MSVIQCVIFMSGKKLDDTLLKPSKVLKVREKNKIGGGLALKSKNFRHPIYKPRTREAGVVKS